MISKKKEHSKSKDLHNKSSKENTLQSSIISLKGKTEDNIKVEDVVDDENMSNKIFHLEREIADMKRQYTTYMIKMQDLLSETEKASTQKCMTKLAEQLEDKTEMLLGYKKQQQQFLRSQISTTKC